MPNISQSTLSKINSMVHGLFSVLLQLISIPKNMFSELFFLPLNDSLGDLVIG